MRGFRDGYALIIGIANYLMIRKLPEVILDDARDVYNLLRSEEYCGYLDSNIRLLLDAQATADAIRAGVRALAEAAPSGSTAMLFFSGHGGRKDQSTHTKNYLIPYDCDPEHLATTAISGEELTTLLGTIQAQRLLVLFDSCHSGGAGEPKALEEEQKLLKLGLGEDYYERLAYGTGRVIMASSRSNEVSYVLPSMNNSLFTSSLLEALQGKALTRGDGLIRVFDVFDYVSEEVPKRKSQHPIFKATDLENNFPIALYLGGKQVGTNIAQGSIRHESVDKRALREAMVQAFSLEELDELCSDVQQDMVDKGITLAEPLNLETVGGTSKANKILRLIDYMDRRNYLGYLIAVLRRERPGII